MKRLQISFYILIGLSIISCSTKEESFQDFNNISKKRLATKVSSIKSLGKVGGITDFLKDSASSNKGENDSLFISQYPLIENHYTINISYDSIVEYVIDSITNDTISTTFIELHETSRDTVDVEQVPRWMYFDDYGGNGQNITSFYVGVPENIVLDKIELQAFVTDTLPTEGYSLLYMGVKHPEFATGPGTNELFFESLYSDTHWLEISEDDLEIIRTEVPIYDEKGQVLLYKPGIAIRVVFFKQFQAPLVGETLDRSFKVRVRLNDQYTIESDFNIHFVTPEVYDDRQCWLGGDPNCQDLF